MNTIALFAVLTATMIGSSTSHRLSSVVRSTGDDRIINGETSNPGQFPYLVSLRVFDVRNSTVVYHHICGGSIISDRWILTAAHCMIRPPSNIAIFAGAHHVANDGQLYRVERIVNHPEYDAILGLCDISLLRTLKTIEFNKFVRAIPLGKRFVKADVASITSGWGRYRNAVSYMCFCMEIVIFHLIQKNFLVLTSSLIRNRQNICDSYV